MTIPDEVLQRLVDQVRSGIDVVIDADPAAAQRVVTLAANALTGGGDVITVASPAGELSLSSLIAQISGHPDFDGQDDSVLELGFKRLHVAGRRTVLVLQAPHGMSRSVLRYVQHVSRHAAGLVLVVLASPALDTLLEEPVFTPLRARLRAAAAVRPSALPSPVAASPPPRWRLLWTVSALGIAGAAALAWVGHGPTLADRAGSTRVRTSVPITPAMTPPPPLARLALAEPAALPPHPPLAKSDRTILAHRAAPAPRDYSRSARVRRNWQARPPEAQDLDRYAWDQTYPEPPPFRYGDPRYLRPYAIDRFGPRLYEDDN